MTFGYLRQAVEKRYLTKDEEKAKLHQRFVDYFSQDRVSNRAVDEIPYHLLKAQEWEQLKEYIGSLDVFDKLSIDQRRYEILGYWNAIGNRYNMAMVYQRELDLFEEKGV